MEKSEDGCNIIFNLPAGDEVIKVFDALSHPMRIIIMGILSEKRQYVSELARMANISRPLLYMHLQKLESARLVKSNLEMSKDGKAMKYYEICPFNLCITPEILNELSKTISITKVENS